MITPIKKNIFTIDLFKTPIDFNIAISLVLFFTSIVKPEIILNAATIMIKDKITLQHDINFNHIKVWIFSSHAASN